MVSAWLTFPKPSSGSSISFIYFMVFLFLSPYVSPSSCSSPHIPLCSSSVVIYYCSIQHYDSVTVWSGADLGFHTWEWVAVKGAAGLLISQDLFQSFEGWGGGLLRCMRVERNENPQAQILAEASSFTCQGYTSSMCPDISSIKGVEVHVCSQTDFHIWGQVKRQREIRNRPDRHFFLIPLVITHGAYVSVGHLSLEPSKDIVHHCMLNGFIWVQCFSSSLISSWLTTNA